MAHGSSPTSIAAITLGSGERDGVCSVGRGVAVVAEGAADVEVAVETGVGFDVERAAVEAADGCAVGPAALGVGLVPPPQAATRNTRSTAVASLWVIATR